MKKYLTFFFILFLNLNAHSSTNQEIISHLEKINSLGFKFIQKIDNNNIEKGAISVENALKGHTFLEEAKKRNYNINIDIKEI